MKNSIMDTEECIFQAGRKFCEVEGYAAEQAARSAVLVTVLLSGVVIYLVLSWIAYKRDSAWWMILPLGVCIATIVFALLYA